MTRYVLNFEEIDQTQIAVVGGKGANLGELSHMHGIPVPPGFCVTTSAFQKIMASAPSIDEHLNELSRLKPDDRDAIRTLSTAIRDLLQAVAIPPELTAAITAALARIGPDVPCAVRSSATAEDLPTASFAGQQDTYLNVVGAASILEHISRCWASLFTERAVTYRLRNGVDHKKVHMAVVVQQMVSPQVSGILFTADPLTGNRRVASVEASFGLGEVLVAGMVNPDVYKVRDDQVVSRAIGTKKLAIHSAASGGTHEQAVDAKQQEQAALTDSQVVRLVQVGQQIEAHFGRPQDIEWCLADDEFQIVQSRPITTLFPIPQITDGENHVYLSVGHQQMMTDPFKPLGLSFWQRTTPRPMAEAGGRLFVDVTPTLASPPNRADFLEMVGKTDPLFRNALQIILDREGFVRPAPNQDGPPAPTAGVGIGAGSERIETNPAIVTELIGNAEASLEILKRDIKSKSGPALIEFILAHMTEVKKVLFDPRTIQVIMAGMNANWWVNEHLQTWLGEKNAADTLTQSAPNNVTSEMGLALLDVADAIRPHSEVVAFLLRVENDDFLSELPEIAGGKEARDAIQGWLDKYGMRGAGEIDITRPRWSERPTLLLPIILGNVKNFGHGAAAERFEHGLEQARQKEEELLQRLRALPDGEEKAQETKRMIDRMRTFAGFREYPKYGMVSRYFVYKQALLGEAERLVRSGVLREKEDIFYLRLEELQEVLRTREVDEDLIEQRKEAFKSYVALRPPRVLTSEGEMISGSYRLDAVPAGALVGQAVSAGTIEGRARVILDMAKANLESGDILVTAYTDPSWTPLFVSIAGLVTEVGGLMTHGAVIAREYGLPAVVGVDNATRLIADGQRIRVHGTEGYVEILE